MPCSSARSCSSDFGAFERRRLERGQHQQRAAAVRVQADVPVQRRPAAARIAHVRNRRPRKIQREAGAIEHHLDDVGIASVRPASSIRRYSVVIETDGSANGATASVDRARIEQRLVALHVDHDVAVERCARPPPDDRCRSDGRRASAALAAEARSPRRDAQIVGGDDDARDDRRRGGAPIDVLDHRTAVDVCERLCRGNV